jgi:2-methylisocitrate lyase-like PEP mutase family enzyme
MKDSAVVPDALRRKAEQLRSLHHADQPLVLANAWDAASARLFEEVGFPAVATTSAGIAYTWGFADGERIKRKQMLETVRHIARSVSVPVSADLEAGYGIGAKAVAKTVHDLVAAGAVGLNLEDARGRSRRALLPAPLHAERVFAAHAAASQLGVPVVINARTDVFHFPDRPGGRVAEAVERGNAYLDAGADAVFVPFVSDPAVIAELVRGIRGPVNILAVPGGPSVAELAALGVKRISVGAGIARAALGLARRVARELHEQGTCELIAEWALPFDEMQRLFATPHGG